MPVITNRVAREIVFLPLHPDTSAPLLEERAVAVRVGAVAVRVGP